jgi:hypothetical protein
MPWNPRTESTINQFLVQWNSFHNDDDPLTKKVLISQDGQLKRG